MDSQQNSMKLNWRLTHQNRNQSIKSHAEDSTKLGGEGVLTQAE